MTDLTLAPRQAPERRARLRRYLMTPPEHFAVSYAINPWMDPAVPVDVGRALAEWRILRDTYRRLGHRVDELPAPAGLPDAVYAANGALVTPRVTVGARFAYPQRAAEAEVYADWLDRAGLGPVARPTEINEGEGDLLLAGSVILAGTGFRTTRAAHAEVARLTGLEVITLELVDPRFYHLDTALAVLDDDAIAYLPSAFSPASRAELERRYPDAVIAAEADAAVLGLNLVSDGRNVIMAAAAVGLARDLELRGYVPVPVAMPELLKGGGGIKCCTLEIRRDTDPEGMVP
ncbi:dimethylargininase [Microlunatus parietis]|uniref:Ornithine--oxo-acid transaminase n=1 Tax=Microlunatus parietis TaxID=682979 RepID=A0A7Y9LBQ3_9ACTN|nr:dimethylargininase [Microlunatus parietis]NYE70890.1 ornithine--oxo-acid transaminase [Microlunatus parietis]